jgi:signal transduction histidine kinase
MDSELNLNLIINSLNIGIIATDSACRVIFLNKNAAQFLALDENDTIAWISQKSCHWQHLFSRDV